MKLIKILFGLILLITTTTALSDSCLTIDENINSVCLCIDDLNNCAIVNQTLCMDGTDDHFIFFIPCNTIPDPSNYSGILEYGFDKATTTTQTFYVFILMIIVCAGVIYVLKKIAIG